MSHYATSGTSTITLSSCPHCGNWHTGTCPRVKAIEYHSTGIVKRVEFHPIPSAVIGIEAIKLCIRCGNPALFPTVLPYSSKWDGEIICGNCIVELLDPAIDKANESSEGKSE